MNNRPSLVGDSHPWLPLILSIKNLAFTHKWGKMRERECPVFRLEAYWGLFWECRVGKEGRCNSEFAFWIRLPVTLCLDLRYQPGNASLQMHKGSDPSRCYVYGILHAFKAIWSESVLWAFPSPFVITSLFHSPGFHSRQGTLQLVAKLSTITDCPRVRYCSAEQPRI